MKIMYIVQFLHEVRLNKANKKSCWDVHYSKITYSFVPMSMVTQHEVRLNKANKKSCWDVHYSKITYSFVPMSMVTQHVYGGG
jgi:hypothetical protein